MMAEVESRVIGICRFAPCEVVEGHVRNAGRLDPQLLQQRAHFRVSVWLMQERVLALHVQQDHRAAGCLRLLDQSRN
jgi:hypothetical protein